MKNSLIALLCLVIPGYLFAQKAPAKFGKLDDALVKMTTHPVDSSAEAVVLLDFGETKFVYDSENGLVYNFTRIIRIKVLTKEGLAYGDFEIPYYHNSSSKESISSLKGYTYNFKNGTIEKSKLEKSSIFEEESTKNWDTKKISMPDVKVGSVIELTYTKKSPFIWNLVTWSFQDDIPTVYSEYKATIPQYFDYQLLQSGYHSNIKHEHTTMAGSISIQEKLRTGGNSLGSAAVKTSYENRKFDFLNHKYRWVAKNVPAFKPEAYVASPTDYISKVKFELRGTNYPNSPYKEYMGTWESLNRSFLEHTSFGEATLHSGYMKKELEVISALSTADEKIVALVNLVSNQIEWNDMNAPYATTSLRNAWTQKKGSSADINLIIVAGLRKLGFNTDPVLISTRGHGMIREQFAISDQFNSVVAMVQLKGEIILLDGTNRFLPVGVLPKICLNGKGWRVSKTAPGWIKINPTTKQERAYQANFEIKDSGNITGEVIIIDKGYAAYASHKKLKFNGEEKFFEEVQSKNVNWQIEDYEYSSDLGNDQPFKSKYSLELNEDLIVTGDIIYFNPTLGEIMDENPFKIEKREYPVDFAFPIRNFYMFKFTLPAGYSIEELPKPTLFVLPDKAGKFSYNITVLKGAIQVIVDVKINKPMFVQTEYPVLKQFYNQVVQKCAEQVVLKRTNP